MLQQECISNDQMHNQVQKGPNRLQSVILLLLTDVCVHIQNDGQAHIERLTLPRGNTLQLVDPPTGSQSTFIFIYPHTFTFTCYTSEAMDKCMDKEDNLNPCSIAS